MLKTILAGYVVEKTSKNFVIFFKSTESIMMTAACRQVQVLINSDTILTLIARANIHLKKYKSRLLHLGFSAG